MSSASLQLGGDNWAAKDGNLLGYQKSSSSSVHIPHEFTFTRGSNLAATRVAANGLIEKGRENLAKNTNWEGASLDTAPTNYTGYLLSNGTFNTTSTEGQIRFTTDSSSRAIVITSTISETGIFTQSVYVDEVYTSIAVIDIINRSANATAIAYYEDGVEITAATNVQAGKRYSILWNKTGAASFRFGSGVNTGKAGDIVLSRPQIEQGLVATELIVSPVGSTGLAGLLEDEPRIDYAGGTGSLLLEPSRTNLVTQSEYFDDAAWVSNYTLTSNYTTSPDGGMNAYRVQVGTVNGYLREQISVSSSTDYVFSFYAKRGSATEMKYRVYDFTNTVNIVTNTSYYSQTSASDWVRIEVPFTTTATTASIGVYIDSDGQGNGDFLIWGAQLEQGSYPTSYIPNHSGGSVTRGADDCDGAVNASNFNDTEGVLYVELSYLQDGRLAIKNSDSSDQVVIGVSSGNIFYRAKENNTNIITEFTGVSGILNRKIALRYRSGDTSIFIDGVEYNVNTSNYTLSGLNQFLFVSEGGSNTTYGNVKQVLYFPTALSDAQCSALTVEGLKEEILTSYIAAVDTLEDGAEARLDTYLQNLEDLIV